MEISMLWPIKDCVCGSREQRCYYPHLSFSCNLNTHLDSRGCKAECDNRYIMYMQDSSFFSDLSQ